VGWHYFKIIVTVAGLDKPLQGIRGYTTTDYFEVYYEVQRNLLKLYSMNDIIKIDVWPVSENLPEVQDYIRKVNEHYERKNTKCPNVFH